MRSNLHCDIAILTQNKKWLVRSHNSGTWWRGLCPIVLKRWISYSNADFRIKCLHPLAKWVFSVKVNQICFLQNLQSANIGGRLCELQVSFCYQWKELILQEEKYLNILYNWIGNHRNSLHLHRTLPLRILFLFENRVLEQALTPF